MKSVTYLQFSAIVLFSLFFMSATSVKAQTCSSSNSLLLPYAQNFNTLALTGTSSLLPTGWFFSETGGNATYTAGTGSSGTGDTYSFGASLSTERALGSVADGTVTTIYYGACFTNDTGNVVDAVSIGYTGEQWRLGQSPQTADLLTFQYSLSETTVNGTDFDNFPALNFPSPTTTGTVGALNGNLAANQTVFTGQKISGLNLAPGKTLFIRWFDVNSAGTDNGLGIDNFTLTTVNVPTVTEILDQAIALPGGSTLPVPFTSGDIETIPITNITVSSDNQSVVPNANLTLLNTGLNTWTVQAQGVAAGSATITATVTDDDGNVATSSYVVLVGGVPTCAAGGENQVTPGTPLMDSGSGITLFASNIATTSAGADALDDTWVTAAGAVTSDANAGGLNGTNKNASQVISMGMQSFNITTREMGFLSDINVAPCQGKNISVGRTVLSNNTSLQESAPRPTVLPASVYNYSEGLGGFLPALGSRNALLFEFDTLKSGFGAWFGDVEGRGAGDTRLTVRFFDAVGNRLGTDFVVNETDPSFGNKVSRWIGFTSTSANVKSMLVIVGDNDLFIPLIPSFTGKNDFSPQIAGIGTNENLSFVGAKYKLSPSAANSSINGRVLTRRQRGINQAKVTILNTATLETKSYRTNQFGYYRFDDLQTGDFYIITVASKIYTFNNATQSIQVFDNLDGVNFVSNE